MKTDRFRPVDWSDLSKSGAPVIGYGIERMKAGERRYKPVGYNGKIHPFKTKEEAQDACNKLNDGQTP